MAVAMIVSIMTVMMIMVMMFLVGAGLQKIRLDVEDAIEIEGAALQNVRQLDLATLGAMQLGIGVDAADPRLDLGEFSLGDEIGLV